MIANLTAERRVIAALLQDSLHYLGTLCHYYGIKTPRAHYNFEEPRPHLRARLVMWDRAISLWLSADDRATSTGLVVDAPISRSHGQFFVTYIQDEAQLREYAARTFSLVLELATKCGVDAYEGKLA